MVVNKLEICNKCGDTLVKLLTKLFVKNCDDINNSDVRTAYGNMSGIVGIILNLLLFAFKLLAGVLSSSISVIADAFNNLSDAGSSVVTFLGFRLASRPADKEHPFGHGRYEYVTGVGISIFIFLVGFELLKTSFDKILHPESVNQISPLTIAILAISILIKLWMFYFNKILSKKINSSALQATSIDSLSDSIATTVVLVGLLVSNCLSLNIDGYLGCAVAIFIFIAGLKTFKESFSPLLGNPPDSDFVNNIKETVLKDDMVVGLHDLIVHDYGPGRCIISLHAEISCNEDILKAHDKIDLIEKQLQDKFNCLATIHMDPIAVDDEYTLELKEKINTMITEINNQFSIHDFRIVQGETHTNVIFDLVIPFDYTIKNDDIKALVDKKVKSIDNKLNTVIHIEKSYVN